MDKITCTTCFRKFMLHEAPFRCMNTRCSGVAIDTTLVNETGAPPRLMGRVIDAPSGRFARFKTVSDVECPDCKQTATRKICPHCHGELPVGTGRIDNRIIAIIGGRGAGKSHYIVTLYQRMRNEVGPNFNMSYSAHGDASQERFEKVFLNPLFEEHKVIDSTQAVAVDRETKAPLRFRLSTGNGSDGVRELYLTFFDTAGEDLTSFDTMSNELRYITAADAIVFILDPLQMNDVRDQLRGTGIPLPKIDTSASPGNIVERVRDLFEQEQLVRPGRKIGIPVAFTMSKIDALFPLIDASSPMRLQGEHRGKVNMADIDSVHTEIVSALGTWDHNFHTTVSNSFSNYRLFGVSALGKSPMNDRIDVVSSLRVEDPLLWLLNKFDLVGAEK